MFERFDQMNAVPQALLDHFGVLAAPKASDRSVCTAATPGSSARTMRLLAAALKRLSADCDYETWLRIGAAVFHVSHGSQEGFDCFDAWSSASTKYKAQEVRAKWKSFRLDHPNPRTMGSLRFMVEERGHEWADVCAEADGDVFTVVETEVQQ